MARGRADIANTALRIFLQEMGKAYDEERGLPPYNGVKHFRTVRDFFDDQCCYCGVAFSEGGVNQDHLIPINRKTLGLHAWGNVVAACRDCNAKKQGKDWKDFIIQRAGVDAAERHAKMNAFLAEYKYGPSKDLRATAEELYEEVGSIAMTLINVKVKRAQI